MAGKVDYKQKYQEIKANFMSAVNAAWEDGYQNGAQSAQMEQAAQQQQQSDELAQAANGQPQMGQEVAAPGEEAPEQPGQPQSQNPNGDELDQHIAKLEGMLGKTEINPTELGDLKKTLSDIRSLQVQINLTKSLDSIKNTKMGKLHKSHAPLTITPKLQANLPEQSKKALTKQQEIIEGVFKKWASDEQKAASDISSILSVEGLTKKG
jgi:hypothetical protein